jgi:glycerol-3-phosphate dehydrogenase
LIHGGLRYLEYGDFQLVRESLAERTRWLQLAAHLVKPLRLSIPVENRFGGFGAAVRRFLGLRQRLSSIRRQSGRGLWTIRTGLWLYDRYARDRSLPHHRVERPARFRPPASDDPHAALLSALNPRYRWAAAYYDAQVRFPERFTLELLEDARRLADRCSLEFRLFTYHRALRRGDRIDILPLDADSTALAFRTSAIVNATGAWVDLTLAELAVPSPKLIGGTKGTHLITYRRDLVELLGGGGVYAEAVDGRPVFILPFGSAALVGTTDEPYTGDPDTARPAAAELHYLMDAVANVFPSIRLTDADIDLAYSGVRPLPAVGPATPAAITRRHWLQEHTGPDVPMYSIIGGKLTTCRSLAEDAAQTILKRIGRPVIETSRTRPLSGSRVESRDDPAKAIGKTLSAEVIAAVEELYGPHAPDVLGMALRDAASKSSTVALLDGTLYPVALARYMVEHEWVRRLDDFVERRLMLLYHRRLTGRCLDQLADVLVQAGLLPPQDKEREIGRVVSRLHERFCKRVSV